MSKQFCVFLLILFLALPSHAQSKLPEFIPTSYANLTKLNAGLNVFDWNDPQIIDSYLRITECDLYKRYAQDEFEWNKLRTSMRDYLLKYKTPLPAHMEFVRPIKLSEYNFNLNGFAFATSDKILTTTRLIVSGNADKNISPCASDRMSVVSIHFPLNMVLSFEKPFELSFIPVPQEIAEQYVRFLDQNKSSQRDGRQAFLRIRFLAERWQPLLKDGSDEFIHMYGSLVSLDVFADKDLTLPLFSKKL
jgi:hypothetical protein